MELCPETLGLDTLTRACFLERPAWRGWNLAALSPEPLHSSYTPVPLPQHHASALQSLEAGRAASEKARDVPKVTQQPPGLPQWHTLILVFKH